MKHSVKITAILVSLFLLAQLIGLFIVDSYLVEELPYDIQRPEFEEETSFIPIFVIIIIATIIAMILARFRAESLWKIWFFLAVVFTLAIAFSSVLPEIIALILSLLLAILKVFRRNLIVHNFTELFIYGGLAAIFVPILSILSISILLVLISLYDIYAVWKSKHMVKLAKFQAKMKLFAGIFIPYEKKTAILGGGDIGFPLLFAGVILDKIGLLSSIIVILFSTLALLLLLIYSKKGRFYPAMPFISAGCFLGYLVVLLI